MKVIYKYETIVTDSFSLLLPRGAEILCVQVDEKSNNPCIWAIVDPTQPSWQRYFELFGTGHSIHEDIGIERKYIGTYQLSGGGFVGHLFERIN
jgi:hypothetical protein